MSLESIAQRLETRLSDFNGLAARIVFDLGEDGAISIDGTASPPVLSQEDVEADCRFRVSTEDLGKLIDGSLNPMLAYTMGKLKIDGSMGIAMKVAALLED
ncbi:MAG: SCP2 sterol-binding domain-containing protein [Kiloniellales bacterium]